ncbi:MAG: Fe-S cluster assembly protein SufD [Flavobacteriaceae bacterium]
MELKEQLLASFIAFEEGVDQKSPLHQKRIEALAYFEKNGFPTKKNEAWKYTSLGKILDENYILYPQVETPIELKDVKTYFLYEIDTYKIVFIDGVYSPFLSDTTHDGLDVCLFSAAISKPRYAQLIQKYFGNVAPENDSLTALNTAYAKEGAYIYIPKNTVAQKPIEILHFSTGKNAPIWLQPRNLIVADENAQVQIIERHQSLSDAPVTTNSVTEVFAEKEALVDYYKVQNDRSTASLLDHTYISQQKNSHVSVHTFAMGGNIVRNTLNFYQKDRHIMSTLKGVTLLEDKQHTDHSTLVHHAHPDCESHQDYKGIIGGRAIGVFNGKILVDKIAQKTNAFQQNNNLLLNDKATINTKPQLEIFADDVRCSHGCTVGQLDEDALFYLRSRGIPKKEAQALLTYAFASNVLESVQISALKKRIEDAIAKKLGVNLGFNL